MPLFLQGNTQDSAPQIDGQSDMKNTQVKRQNSNKKSLAVPPGNAQEGALNANGSRRGSSSAGKGKELNSLPKKKKMLMTSEMKPPTVSVGSSKRPAAATTPSGTQADNTMQRPLKISKLGKNGSCAEATFGNTSNGLKEQQEEESDITSKKPNLQHIELSLIPQKCLPIIKRLMMHSSGWIFNNPVDPVELGLPDYFDIVKNPMNLALIEKRLESGFYKDLKDVERDTKLVFRNTILYNGRDSEVGEIAENVLITVEKEFSTLQSGK